MDKTLPKILILGGGYGGLQCALRLQKTLPDQAAEVTFVSKHDYHYQTTLLHKVAIGTLSARKARIFYRKILDLKKINFIKDTILSLDPDKKTVQGSRLSYTYDYLVVGLGFKPETFGVPGADEYAYKLHTLNTALELADDIENKFKDYVLTQNKEDLHVVVTGTGFTSIEFAAELGTQFDDLCTICGIDRKLARVTCIGRTEEILPEFNDKLTKVAKEKLDNLGVEIIGNTDVIGVLPDGVRVRHLDTNEEEVIHAGTVVWCAGVSGNDVVEASVLPSQRGRVNVDEYLRVPEYPEVFMVGDCAVYTLPDGTRIPSTAQLASQMGQYLGDILPDVVQGREPSKKFSYHYRGTVCSIGHTDGVGVAFGKSLKGELAAFMKNTIENRWLFSIGGQMMVFRKGQFRFRSSN